MENPADFNQDLTFGQKSEKLFLKLYRNKWNLVPTDGKSGDFLLNGKKMELKSDKYKLSETGNLFLETIRNTNTNAPGGVIQAVKEHNVEIFMYWFPEENIYFKFNAQKLMKALPELTGNCKAQHIENEGYYTIGYLVKADKLLPFCEETNVNMNLFKKEENFKKKAYSLFQTLMKRA